MPNYCYDTLTITGNSLYMSELYDFIGTDVKSNFTMNKFIPMPEELKNTDSPIRFIAVGTKKVIDSSGNSILKNVNDKNQTEEEFIIHNNYLIDKYEYDNWYDWAYANWGCKWDIDIIDILEESDTKLSINYDTAWNPNYQFIEFLGLQFPNLKFELEYYEPGNSFAGKFHVQSHNCYDENYSINLIVFAKIEESEVFKFFNDEDTEEYLEYEEYEDYEYIDIINCNWKEAFSRAGYDYNKDNVINWTEFLEYISNLK